MIIIDIILAILYVLAVLIFVLLVIALAIPVGILYGLYWLLFKSWHRKNKKVKSVKIPNGKASNKSEQINRLVKRAIRAKQNNEDFDKDAFKKEVHDLVDEMKENKND